MPRVLNIAHAGGRSLAPENTLAAAKKALEVGADMWELDVAVTLDGKLILFHDDSLARTTDAARRFPDRAPWTFTTFTFEEIRTLDAGSWFVETDPFGEIAAGRVTPEELASYRGERIPTLEEALRFTKERRFRVNVELKRLPPPQDRFPVVERVLSLIDRLNAADYVVISSFNHDWLRQVETQWPDIQVQALVGYPYDAPNAWDNFHFKTYSVCAKRTDAAEIRMLRAKGLGVNVWTVNEERDMERFIAAGATGLFTDFPHRLSALLHQRDEDG